MAHIQEARSLQGKLNSPTASEDVWFTLGISLRVARTAVYTCLVTYLVVVLDTSPLNSLYCGLWS